MISFFKTPQSTVLAVQSTNSFAEADIEKLVWLFGDVITSYSIHYTKLYESIEAGTNVDLGGLAYAELRQAVKDGKLQESVIDSAAYNVLRWKFAMGLFDNPYVDPKEAKKKVHSEASIALARELAQQSTVLLENKGVLPLNKKGVKLAVIGPNADVMYNQLGDYTSPQPAENVVTVLEGIQAKVRITSYNVCYTKLLRADVCELAPRRTTPSNKR